MAISKGNTGIGKVYVGQKEVEKAFVGDKLIYQSGIPVDPVFANNDWATIRKAVRSGNIPATWVVGDTKDITLSNGQTISYRIADKQAGRYALADGSGSSNMVLEPLTLISNLTAPMNSSYSNSGGFAQCQMRSVTLVNVLALFPTDVQNAMSEVLVLSSMGGKSTSGTSSSANKIFLAAVRELYPDNYGVTIGLEECPLGQFDYYKTHTNFTDKVKQKDGSDANYWLRSPYILNGGGFIETIYAGTVRSADANQLSSVAPFFAI